jgi:hypothetical protein
MPPERPLFWLRPHQAGRRQPGLDLHRRALQALLVLQNVELWSRREVQPARGAEACFAFLEETTGYRASALRTCATTAFTSGWSLSLLLSHLLRKARNSLFGANDDGGSINRCRIQGVPCQASAQSHFNYRRQRMGRAISGDAVSIEKAVGQIKFGPHGFLDGDFAASQKVFDDSVGDVVGLRMLFGKLPVQR